MALMSYADSALSIFPPLVAITLAIVTRKVLISLGLGILMGILMLTNFSLSGTFFEVIDRATGLVWDGSGLALWNIYTVSFLLCMGALMALISVSGGTRALAQWAHQRIASARDAKLMTIFLGLIVFIDDYFNALLVGNVARPVTDHYKISREKLAYCIDSTSAPICVISPISTWGAYIMSLLAGILVANEVVEYSALSAFVSMIPLNYYALVSFGLLLCVAVMRLDIGPMASAEYRAQKGKLWDPAKGLPPGEDVGLPEAETGKVFNFVGPLLLLVALVIGLMMYSGASGLAANGEAFTLIGALENADGAWAMAASGIVTVAFTVALLMVQGVPTAHIGQAFVKGLQSMLPAVYILLMAWTIAGVIGDLETGKYLASLASGNLPSAFVPVLAFLIAAAAAFSTGTSYGTFAIMLPIAANMAFHLDAELLMPAMAAVLAGGVFGDHCSPISDTTILSSTGSGCHHIDHVATQLPYALLAALVSMASYFTVGLTGSLLAGLGVALVGLVLVVLVLRRLASTSTQGSEKLAH
ncbi:Na+/H+ antiporter NhaC family protein [Pseudovibrio sp. SPO723]|uniref:Na+/H+ antiporter NhaC family protein n=1 Tax=Nesiotobacter zosterae TaxID=392721 RepID=UPI0029CA958B|nr:Na+/H+ antiporter NhaC family protein [Pseudovibrio sp. SPO723]